MVSTKYFIKRIYDSVPNLSLIYTLSKYQRQKMDLIQAWYVSNEEKQYNHRITILPINESFESTPWWISVLEVYNMYPQRWPVSHGSSTEIMQQYLSV